MHAFTSIIVDIFALSQYVGVMYYQKWCAEITNMRESEQLSGYRATMTPEARECGTHKLVEKHSSVIPFNLAKVTPTFLSSGRHMEVCSHPKLFIQSH